MHSWRTPDRPVEPPEVLSGDFYTQLSTSTPHQIWSSAMVISPILRGMMGLEVNALNSTVTFAPHVPAGWNEFTIKNVKVGETTLDLMYHVVGEDFTLEVQRHGSSKFELNFSPAFSPRAKILAAEVNGQKVTPKISANDSDQHATLSVPITTDKTTIHLHVTGDFAVGYLYPVPADGAASTALKFVSSQWSAAHDQLQLQVAGIGGQTYSLPLFNAPSGIAVHGAKIVKPGSGLALEVGFPPGAAGAFTTSTVTLDFPKQ